MEIKEKLKLQEYFNNEFQTTGIKILPQNINKNSRPAILINRTSKNPDDLLWIYKKGTYYGFLVSKELYNNSKDVKSWTDSKSFKKKVEGNRYILIVF